MQTATVRKVKWLLLSSKIKTNKKLLEKMGLRWRSRRTGKQQNYNQLLNNLQQDRLETIKKKKRYPTSEG